MWLSVVIVDKRFLFNRIGGKENCNMIVPYPCMSILDLHPMFLLTHMMGQVFSESFG